MQSEVRQKSQSKKIRDLLFRLWEKKPEGFVDFEEYYNEKTNKYINFLLKKLDDTPPAATYQYKG